jgi:hypothetical protein
LTENPDYYNQTHGGAVDYTTTANYKMAAGYYWDAEHNTWTNLGGGAYGGPVPSDKAAAEQSKTDAQKIEADRTKTETAGIPRGDVFIDGQRVVSNTPSWFEGKYQSTGTINIGGIARPGSALGYALTTKTPEGVLVNYPEKAGRETELVMPTGEVIKYTHLPEMFQNQRLITVEKRGEQGILLAQRIEDEWNVMPAVASGRMPSSPEGTGWKNTPFYWEVAKRAEAGVPELMPSSLSLGAGITIENLTTKFSNELQSKGVAAITLDKQGNPVIYQREGNSPLSDEAMRRISSAASGRSIKIAEPSLWETSKWARYGIEAQPSGVVKSGATITFKTPEGALAYMKEVELPASGGSPQKAVDVANFAAQVGGYQYSIKAAERAQRDYENSMFGRFDALTGNALKPDESVGWFQGWETFREGSKAATRGVLVGVPEFLYGGAHFAVDISPVGSLAAAAPQARRGDYLGAFSTFSFHPVKVAGEKLWPLVPFTAGLLVGGQQLITGDWPGVAAGAAAAGAPVFFLLDRPARTAGVVGQVVSFAYYAPIVMPTRFTDVPGKPSLVSRAGEYFGKHNLGGERWPLITADKIATISEGGKTFGTITGTAEQFYFKAKPFGISGGRLSLPGATMGSEVAPFSGIFAAKEVFAPFEPFKGAYQLEISRGVAWVKGKQGIVPFDLEGGIIADMPRDLPGALGTSRAIAPGYGQEFYSQAFSMADKQGFQFGQYLGRARDYAKFYKPELGVVGQDISGTAFDINKGMAASRFRVSLYDLTQPAPAGEWVVSWGKNPGATWVPKGALYADAEGATVEVIRTGSWRTPAGFMPNAKPLASVSANINAMSAGPGVQQASVQLTSPTLLRSPSAIGFQAAEKAAEAIASESQYFVIPFPAMPREFSQARHAPVMFQIPGEAQLTRGATLTLIKEPQLTRPATEEVLRPAEITIPRNQLIAIPRGATTSTSREITVPRELTIPITRAPTIVRERPITVERFVEIVVPKIPIPTRVPGGLPPWEPRIMKMPPMGVPEFGGGAWPGRKMLHGFNIPKQEYHPSVAATMFDVEAVQADVRKIMKGSGGVGIRPIVKKAKKKRR